MRSPGKMSCILLAAFGFMAALNTTSVFALEKAAKIDINNASAKEMEDTLDGVGAATAKKIIDGRPYKTIDDLVKAGVPEKTAEKIAPHIVFGRHEATAHTRTETVPAGKIDINNATAKELEDTLDGVGVATAKKIVEGRPYKTVDDLVKAGVPEKTAEKIAPHIYFGKHDASHEKTVHTDKKEDPVTEKKVDKKTTDKTTTDTESRVAPAKGMVWVNTKSHVYHVEGDRWYGKTEKGEFMTEDDAIKAGAHKSKQD